MATSTDPSSFNTYVEHLRQRLSEPLPGVEAQLQMAPRYRQDAALARVEDKQCREAGVLALLFPLDATPALLLTVRHPDLKDHAGQVSFPGGRREADETLVQTALREAREEVGVDPADVEVLGSLTPLYIPPSNFCVYPFIGATPHAPQLYPQDAEVDAVLQVPLSHLLDPATRRREPWMLRGQEVEVPFLHVEGYKVWGATAMMLSELLVLLADAR